MIIFPLAYITNLQFVYFITECVPLDSSHLVHAYTPLPSVTTSCFIMSVSLFLFVCFVFQIPHICIKTYSLFVSLWLISISIIPSGSIHLSQMARFYFFMVIFHYLYLYFLNFILFNFTILCWFCHISKWICHYIDLSII